MTVLDPSDRPWDSTPKRYIITTSHRVRHDPVLNGTIEQAQLNQSRVYDQVLEHFDRHAAFPFQAPAGKPSPPCLAHKGLVRAGQGRHHPRRAGKGGRRPPGRSTPPQRHPRRARAQEARALAPGSSGSGRKSRNQTAAGDRREAPCGSSCRARQSGNGSGNDHDERHERKAVPGKWHLPGLGQLELLAQDQIPAGADIRSCHLVERTRPGTPIERRRYVLKVQLGKPVPEAKEGADIGIDYGIRNTVTTSTGKRLQRPETGALEDEARALRAYARGRCKKRSRRYQDLYREAKKLSRKIARIHDNWEREAAKTLCAGTAMIRP